MKAKWKRGLALVLTVAMTGSCIPVTAAADTTVDLLADFNFDDEASGFTGGNAKATGTYTLADSFDTDNGKALYLNGSSTNYLTVTDLDGGSLLTGKEEITISMDMKQNRTSTNWPFFAAPNSDAQSWPYEHYIGVMVSGSNGTVKIERYDNEGSRPACPEAAAGTDWAHIDIVLAKETTTLYIDGTKKGVVDSAYSLPDILEDSSIIQIGKANWGTGEFFQGWIDNFKIYDGALTDADLISEEVAAAAVAADKAALTLPEEVTENFVLPSVGENSSIITWTVEENANAVIDDDGYSVAVTRSDSEDVTVTFTATLTMGAVTDTKTFDVVVKREATDADVVADAADLLDIVNKDAVKGNVTLPTEVEVEGTDKVASVTWKSSDPSIVTDTDMDGKAAGVVTRQADDTEVVMTAEISCGGETVTKEITLNVIASPADLDDDYTAGYMWAHFGTSGGYEKMFFGYSEDGLTWNKLNKDENGTAQPVLTNDAPGSDLGVRDPHFIRSAEGDKYWIIGTDLHAEGGGAGGSGWNQTSASQNIVVWESDDLVNWSEPKLIFAGLDTAGCVWAPEAIYDEAAGDYLVYWAARDYTYAGTNDNALRMYVCRTRDFVNFTEPKVWLSEDPATSTEYNIIDSTIVEADGKFYRFSTSDWNTVIDVSDTLSEDLFDVRVNSDTSVNGDWTRLVKRGQHSSAGISSVEGFTVYQLPDGRWCAMGDNGGYRAFVTDDLSSATFTTATATFPDGAFRHGTVMRLSEAEQERVLAAYGEKEAEDEPIVKTVLAQFDFDDEETGFISENAKATGTHTLTDSYNEANGQALYLNGSSTNFLSVTDLSGGSLLTDARELTVSLEIKPANTGTNWPFYAAPSAVSPKYNVSEHYIGMLLKDGSITVECYNQDNSTRPTNPSAVLGSDWTRVDVVMTANKTSLYINGMLQSEVSSSYKIQSILGSSSILQIGKANWGNGEFYTGWIDNVTILNYALTADEVKDAAADFVSTLPVVDGAVVGTAPDSATAAGYRGTDDHTAITTLTDKENNILTPYVRKHADVTKLPVTFVLNADAEITVNGNAFVNGSELDLTNDVQVVVTNSAGKEETWTLKAAVVSNNPVLPGQYADPDIDYFDGKFWIFPTTDGYSGWSGAVFHAWSSDDMVNWTDEGIIMDLANDNPGLNEKGVQIASSSWAVGSAWAPSIEEKDGKYYFYYCGKFTNGQSAIGVAVADDPAGPYVDKGEALMTVSMCSSAGVSMGQAIDPSIFTDEDGTSYILFGNGAAAMAELNDDMMSIKVGTLRQINGLRDFRESVVVMKVDGKYHWTWSCDDAGSPNYHVNYGISNTIDGNVAYIKTLLQKDESKDMLGTAHQSMLHITDANGDDRYFMAYHRFYTPLGIYTSGLGYHRETCIDEITFDANGYMQITPTLEGVSEVITADNVKLPYEDVAEDAWYYDVVYYNYVKGYMTGKSATIFAPDETLTRAELTSILYRINGEPEVEYDAVFSDVPADAWYASPVFWAYENKVVSGYAEGDFKPDNAITREQLAVIMHNYAAAKDYETDASADLDAFDDAAQVGDWAKPAVQWAVAAGVISGKDGVILDPQGNATRAEAAAIIQRFMENIVK